MNSKFLTILLGLILANSAWSAGILNRKITVEIKQTPVKKILHLIEERGSVLFTYNPDLIDENEVVSLSIQNRTIAYGLSLIFKDDVRFKAVGNHIILLKNENAKAIKQRKKEEITIHYTGVITDKRTNEVLNNVSVYDVDSRNAVVSGANGVYSLRLIKEENVRSIYVRKRGYKAYVYVLDATNDSLIVKNIALEPLVNSVNKLEPQQVEKIYMPVEERALSGSLVSHEMYLHGVNLEEIREMRTAQLGLVPSVSIGSNLSTNGLIVNRFSLNILAGYSNGVEGAEIGGILNMAKGDVRWFQAGGIGNMVGGNVEGAQAGGIFNSVRGNFVGAQLAGINNTLGGDLLGGQASGIFSFLNGEMEGAQVSGIFSILRGNGVGGQFSGILGAAEKDFKGIQMSGVAGGIKGEFLGLQASGIAGHVHKNFLGLQLAGILATVTGNVNGAQVAGISSIVRGELKGWQVSGISNLAVENASGFQVAGISNIAAKGMTGMQLAGISNFSKEGTTFLQVSSIFNYSAKNQGLQTGLVNVAKKNQGLQVGLINISGESQGVSLGLFNFVKNGYFALDLAANELFPLNATLKTGVKKFYNSYSFSYRPWSNTQYAAGLGFGSHFDPGERWGINLDLTGQFAIDQSQSIYVQIYRFSPTVDFKLARWARLFIGPSINGNVALFDAGITEYESELSFEPFYEESFVGGYAEFWLGGQAGIRFQIPTN